MIRRTPDSTPCVGNPDFTSDDRDVLLRAAMACFSCRRRVACRQEAEGRGEKVGVWGGKVFGWHKKWGEGKPRRPLPDVCDEGLHDLTVPGARRDGKNQTQCRACVNARARRPVRCECGRVVARAGLSGHRRTKQHIAHITQAKEATA